MAEVRRFAPAAWHAVALFVLCDLVWSLLFWTLTAEVIGTGLVVSVVLTIALLPLYRDTATIRVTPRRAARALGLAGYAATRVVVANFQLARRIWAPSRPLRTGMVAVPTRVRSDAGLGTVGVVTSLIVDNQITDVDRSTHRLLYHAVDMPAADEAYDRVNGPIDRRVARLEHGASDA